MRQCIEWQLHLRPTQALDPLTEQHHRRIFWECYVLDRYSSGILGRPFAIMESNIDVPLPFDANDEHLIDFSNATLDLVPVSDSQPTEVSVFIFGINTGSGTRTPDFKSIGHVYTAFAEFRKELNDWRATAPMFPFPRSLYERSEWHDFLLEKDLLLLARGVMHNIQSKPYAGAAVKEILTTCYVSASRIIELYADLMEKRAITWTRSYFQVIFTAGLTVIFCVSLDMLEHSTEADVEQRDPAKTLNLCSRILTFFKDKMPDAGSSAVVFDVLKDECLKDKMNIGHPTTIASVQDSTASQYQNFAHDTSQGVHEAYSSAFEALFQDNINPRSSMDHYGSNFGTNTQNFDFGLSDDLMMQLEASLGEYAWGSIPMDGNFWNQVSFNY
ncbi:hypothetical protein DE146DRAFT_611320 [Phaeosphaeria sp. MPI-PUGE-AT-0046c]|nr:hypothetical protein DE146DRAFT_611320 [Phaeosphaeria sp. MPI-PUGE-AT-0046c]